VDFNLSQSQTHWLNRVRAFIAAEILPATAAVAAERTESRAPAPTMERLKDRAKAEGLWNLFLPPSPEHDTVEYRGAGLTNLDYALCAEAMGRVGIASEVFNCAAPDTGNMEVLHRYGSPASDATNIATSIRRDGDHYVIDGRKWWSTGVGDPRCRIAILMGKTDPDAPRHRQQTQILVPMDTPGVRVERLLPVFGYEDAPKGHGEVVLEHVRVPAGNLILGEGRGFEIAQGRLGPGRIHHCMRTIGAAEVALEAMARRLVSRVAFGKRISEQSVWEQRVAEARIDIEMARLLCLKAADMMDKVGAKGAKLEIAMIKVAAPRVALKVIDDAIQAHGGAGVSEDFGLARMYAHIRTLRLADGPDEVHNRSIARLEFGRYTNAREGA
jgi:acyl-CoA dehydrogenase